MSTAAPDLRSHAAALPVFPGPQRSEPRVASVRIAEYGEYPRASRDAGRRVGFTCDHSTSGMRLSVEEPHETGALLRVVLHGLDGAAARDAIARVVWCRATTSSHAATSAARHDTATLASRHEIGLAIVAEAHRAVRPARQAGAPQPTIRSPRVLMGRGSGQLGS